MALIVLDSEAHFVNKLCFYNAEIKTLWVLHHMQLGEKRNVHKFITINKVVISIILFYT